MRTILFILICFLTITFISSNAVEKKVTPNEFILTFETNRILQQSHDLNQWNDLRSKKSSYTNHYPLENEYFKTRKIDYSLFSNYSTNNDVALLNFDQEVINIWSNQYSWGTSVYLLDDGSIIKSGQVPNPPFLAPGWGGNIQRLDWNSNVIWNYNLINEQYLLHHDIEILPNGNILAIAWDVVTENDAIDLGRNPLLLRESAGNVVWSEAIIELQTNGTNTPEIIWIWKARDHLIQDFDNTKDNFGIIANHPELINFNYPENDDNPDWLHFNGIDYNEELDQILLSCRTFSEIWIIDHSTTTEEAAGHSGGNSGKGGDLLYRYGNPSAYNKGDVSSQSLQFQHNPNWISKGLLGEGNILIFNNGNQRGYSSVDEITPPLNNQGLYDLLDNGTYGPTNLTWSYDGGTNNFFGPFTSGAQRLHNGHTLVSVGPARRIFEVDLNNEIIWDYTPNTGQGFFFKAERYLFDIPNN